MTQAERGARLGLLITESERGLLEHTREVEDA